MKRCLEAVTALQAKATVYRDFLACLSLLGPAAATEKMLNSCAGYSEQAKKLQGDYRAKYKDSDCFVELGSKS